MAAPKFVYLLSTFEYLFSIDEDHLDSIRVFSAAHLARTYLRRKAIDNGWEIDEVIVSDDIREYTVKESPFTFVLERVPLDEEY